MTDPRTHQAARRLRAHARGEHDAGGGLHARRGTQRKAPAWTSTRSSTAGGCWPTTSSGCSAKPTTCRASASSSAINKSRYDALTFLFQRRMPRRRCRRTTRSPVRTPYGGSTGNRSGAGLPQVWDQPFAESEWGPNGPDERHRFVVTGVFDVAVRHPALARRAAGERAAVQPDGRLGPERRRQQQRPLDRSGDRPAGLAQLGTRRQHVRLRHADDEVLRASEGTRGSASSSKPSTSSTR